MPALARLRRIAASSAALALSALAFWIPAAPAAFHEILVREVYAGGTANDSYVVLQAYSGGQNFVEGHAVTAYDPAGGAIGTFAFSDMVANGQNQMTILVADTAYAATFPSGPAPDATMANLNLDPAGGAACWAGLDCVSWGSFGGATSPTAGAPAAPAGIPAGMAIRRTIAPGCATLLEVGDDRDDSAADFSLVFPAPRSNPVPPPERPCGQSESQPGSGGPAGKSAPQTRLGRKPPPRTRDRTPTFRFSSDEPGSSFQCKLDGKPFRTCRSPFTTKRLSPGRHIFKVRARGDSGTLDPTPAVHTFKVTVGNPKAR